MSVDEQLFTSMAPGRGTSAGHWESSHAPVWIWATQIGLGGLFGLVGEGYARMGEQT